MVEHRVDGRAHERGARSSRARGRACLPRRGDLRRPARELLAQQVRAGYRAPHCRALAEGFAAGDLREADFLDPELATDELRRRLLALPGFGPYAAGQALRLLGRFDDLALDSWVRKRAAELHDLPAGDDAAIASRYADFGRHAGLALWLDVTRSWHEGEDEIPE